MKLILLAAPLTMCCIGPALAQDADKLLKGEWDMGIKLDPMTDAKVVRLVKVSNDGKRALLAFKCDAAEPKSVYMQILTPEYLGGDEDRTMMVRFGSEEAAKTRLYAKDSSALLFDFDRTQRIARKMITVEKVSFRVSDYRYRTYDYTFDLTGAAEHMPALFRECNSVF